MGRGWWWWLHVRRDVRRSVIFLVGVLIDVVVALPEIRAEGTVARGDDHVFLAEVTAEADVPDAERVGVGIEHGQAVPQHQVVKARLDGAADVCRRGPRLELDSAD